MNEPDLIEKYIAEALAANGGAATLIQVAKHIWDAHEGDLRAQGDLFYRWQYVMRWSANSLAKKGRMSFDPHTRGLWHLLPEKVAK
jgi:hypothetical protein